MKYPRVKNYVGGEFVEFGGEQAAVVSPVDGEVLSSVPRSGVNGGGGGGSRGEGGVSRLVGEDAAGSEPAVMYALSGAAGAACGRDWRS